MGPDQKAELFRLGKANGWNPQETVDHWLKGTDFRKYAEEKGIDLDKDTTKYYATSKNRTDLNTAVAAGAELDSLDDQVLKPPTIKLEDDPLILTLITNYFIINTLHHISILQI